MLQNCYLSIVAALQKICGRACCPATIDKQQFRSNEFPRTILENDVPKSGRTHWRKVRGFLSLQNGYLSIVAALQKMCGRACCLATIGKQHFRSKEFPRTLLKNDMQKTEQAHLRKVRGFLSFQRCCLSIVAAPLTICGRTCHAATIEKRRF